MALTLPLEVIFTSQIGLCQACGVPVEEIRSAMTRLVESDTIWKAVETGVIREALHAAAKDLVQQPGLETGAPAGTRANRPSPRTGEKQGEANANERPRTSGG